MSGLTLSLSMPWYRLFMPTNIESFKLKYDGEALAENAIDVNDLAPALLALSDLIQDANKIVNQDKGGTVSLKVKAIAPGCFDINIQVLQSGWDAAADLITGKNVTAIAIILAFLGISAKDGLIGLCKLLQGKKPKEVKEINGNEVQITGENNQTIIINKLEYNLYLTPSIRGNLYKVLKPLEKEGIETAEFTSEGKQPTKISKSELGYYQKTNAQDEPLQESERDTYVNVSHVWLDNESGKWKFKEGENNSWSAVISDQEFLKKLIKGEVSITATDTLKVRVKQTQYRTENGIKSEYEIVKIIDHIKGAQQIPIIFTGKENVDE